MTSTNSNIKCETCSEGAYVRVVWGLYNEPDGAPRATPMQEADLCVKCSDSLWDKCRGAVTQGLTHFAVTKYYKLDRIREQLNALAQLELCHPVS